MQKWKPINEPTMPPQQHVFFAMQIGELFFVRQKHDIWPHPSGWPTERDTAQRHADLQRRVWRIPTSANGTPRVADPDVGQHRGAQIQILVGQPDERKNGSRFSRPTTPQNLGNLDSHISTVGILVDSEPCVDNVGLCPSGGRAKFFGGAYGGESRQSQGAQAAAESSASVWR